VRDITNIRIRKEEELKIVGMHCTSCVNTVSKAIKGVNGVEDVKVNLASGEAKVVLSGNLKDVINAVRRAGYDVVTQKIYLNVDISEEEAGKLKEVLECLPGVIEAKVGGRNAVVEINPVTTTEEKILEELRKRGYKAELSKSTIGKKSDFKDLLTRLIVGIIFTTPILFLPPLYQFVLSFPVQFYSGMRFHKGAIRAIKNKTANMDVLVSLSSTVAWVYSLYGLLTNSQTFFTASSLLITFILIGKTLEAYLKERVSNDVLSLTNVKARKIEGEKEVIVDSNKLKVGDVVLIKSGDVIPADGVVEEGEGYVNESIYTGEVTPSYKRRGDPVIGGSVLERGFLKVYVTRAGNRAYITQVAEAIREADTTRFPIQQFVDKVSAVFVPVVIIISVISFVVWRFILHFPLSFSVLIAVAVLASACPCGFGLATPMAIIVGVRRLAKRGIIVKNGEGLERLKEVKTFIFDKTGTITKGKIKVSKYEGEIELACALEKLSNHPIAKAIASLKGVNAEIKEFTEFQGKGVYGVVNGKAVIVGNKDFVMSNCTGNSKDADVLVCIDGEVRGYIWLEDEIREEAFEVVKWLKERGYNVIIATGDSSSFAEKVGEALGVKVYNGLSPEEKVELVKKFEKVAFVGDGVNDAMALKESYVGIAVSSGADIAKYAGDIVIPSLSSIPQLLERGSKIVRKVKENVIWALAYNTVLIPISAGILYPFYLPPQYAALAMSMNSVSVVLWSLVDSL